MFKRINLLLIILLLAKQQAKSDDKLFNVNPLIDKENLINQADKNLDEKENWQGSLMFNTKELTKLKEAMRISSILADSNIKQKDENNSKDLQVLQLLEKPPTISPAFYLDSIIYYNKSKWLFWLNKHKISPDSLIELNDISPFLKLISINNNELQFEWKTGYLEKISPKWREELHLVSNNTFINDDSTISLDQQIVTFKLKSNQSFSVYEMKIKEGFTNSVNLINFNE